MIGIWKEDLMIDVMIAMNSIITRYYYQVRLLYAYHQWMNYVIIELVWEGI